MTLLAIVLLFAVPVLVAVLMHSRWWDYQPASTTNLGQLVVPPVSMDPALLELDATTPATQGRWTIMYPVSPPCTAACLDDIRGLRQVHLAAGRHRSELAIMLLLPASERLADGRALLETYADFSLARDRSGAVGRLLADMGGGGAGAARAGQAFLVDPAGNIMLRYTPGYDPNDINKDLKRLLKWSGQDSK
jgi:hypothetical protein